jgi:hypothetical protein
LLLKHGANVLPARTPLVLPVLPACAGNNPIMLVGTKVDLLPAGADPAAVADWLLAAAGFKRITAASVHLVGAALRCACSTS